MRSAIKHVSALCPVLTKRNLKSQNAVHLLEVLQMGREELAIQESRVTDKLTPEQRQAIAGLSIYTLPLFFYRCIQDRLSKEVWVVESCSSTSRP